VRGWQLARRAAGARAHPAGGRRVRGCCEAGHPLVHAGGGGTGRQDERAAGLDRGPRGHTDAPRLHAAAQ